MEEESLRQIVDLACEAADSADLELCLERMDACLDALEQVDRNANQALVVSHWLHSLAPPVRSMA